jgi:hypothetical protein
MNNTIDPLQRPSIVECLDVGSHVARRAITGGQMRYPENMQLKACARGLYAWRALMEGVLAGDTEAVAIARKALERNRLPESEPNKEGA